MRLNNMGSTIFQRGTEPENMTQKKRESLLALG